MVLRGEADIGIQQMVELMAVDGIDVVGPLPSEIQMVTLFVAGIPANASDAEAGRVVIDFSITPEAKRVSRRRVRSRQFRPRRARLDTSASMMFIGLPRGVSEDLVEISMNPRLASQRVT